MTRNVVITRDELQAQAVEAVMRDRYVMVNWGTGVGKSRVAVESISRLFRDGALSILLLVDQGVHKKNWLLEFQEAKGERDGRMLYDSITVECYASLSKYEGTSWDFIVADEAHHLRSAARTGGLSTISARRMLCLSATISCRGDADDLLEMLDSRFGRFTTFDFGIQDAIDNRILAEPTIWVHALPLEDIGVRMQVVEEWGRAAKRVALEARYEDRAMYRDKTVFPAATLTIDCSAAQAYEYYSKQIEVRKKAWRESRENAGLEDGQPDTKVTEMLLTRLKRSGLLRKEMLGAAKTKFAKWLVGKMAGKRFVCFCSDIGQARELGGDNLICSEVSDSGAVIDAFNAGEKDSLFAVKMAKEGQNLRNIEAGIVLQLSGKDREFIQQIGRAFRSKDPQQHIVVIDGTRDIDYLRDSLSSFDRRYVKVRGYGSLAGRPLTIDDLHGDAKAVEAARAVREEGLFSGLLTNGGYPQN